MNLTNLETRGFLANREILKDFRTAARQLLRQAEAFDEFSRRMNRNLERNTPFEPYEVGELLQGYRMVQTYNRMHNPEAGAVLAAEIKRWQAARVEVLHGVWQEKKFLPCTDAQTQQFEETHAWFIPAG